MNADSDSLQFYMCIMNKINTCDIFSHSDLQPFEHWEISNKMYLNVNRCSGTKAVPGRSHHDRQWLVDVELDRLRLKMLLNTVASDPQALPQYGWVQPLRAAGRQHPPPDGWGPQGQLLPGGHFLWLWLLQAICLHCTHPGLKVNCGNVVVILFKAAFRKKVY